ncbi:MAG TPA: DUF4159 domain-containing protein [Bacteroidales bacterium]|nr:DUF4159 domain-containing protein [Bacteroidales bacterium]
MKLFFAIILLSVVTISTSAQVKIALLKYSGGGDWYANPTSLPNLVKFCNANMGTNIVTDIPTVDPGSSDIFNYPFIHMTGHGNVMFSEQEVENLRQYMLSGGFLHIDDNYGMDVFIRPQIKKIFPEYELIEIPFSHAIYHQQYDFPNGLPKIHEHDAKPPKGYGIVVDGRIVLFYTYECDLGDGWESHDVHNDSQETRTKALQMGANIIRYVFNGD